MNATDSSSSIAATAASLFAAMALVGTAPTAAASEVTPALRQQAYVAFDSKDYALALVLFERAAAAGDLLAAERAGEMLLEGQSDAVGVPEDLARASRLLRRAACAGSASAAALLDELRRKLDALACGNT